MVVLILTKSKKLVQLNFRVGKFKVNFFLFNSDLNWLGIYYQAFINLLT
jgi:hypothetical protein